MPVTAGLVIGGVKLVGGIIKGISGASQKSQGKNIINGLTYPTESVPQEEIANQNLAQQQAATGLPSEQYDQAMINIQRNQLSAMRGARSGRGGMGLVSGLQQNTNDATLNLDTADAKQKILNQNNLMNQNNRMASWKDKVWQNNVMGKYNQQYNYGMGLMGMGNQNIVGGIDQAASGLGNAAMGLYGQGSNKYSGTNVPSVGAM